MPWVDEESVNSVSPHCLTSRGNSNYLKLDPPCLLFPRSLICGLDLKGDTLTPKPDYKIIPARRAKKIFLEPERDPKMRQKHWKSLPNGRQQGGAFGAAPRGRRFAPPPWVSACLPFGKDFLCFWCISEALVDLHRPPMEITAPMEITGPSAPHLYSGTYSAPVIANKIVFFA